MIRSMSVRPPGVVRLMKLVHNWQPIFSSTRQTPGTKMKTPSHRKGLYLTAYLPVIVAVHANPAHQPNLTVVCSFYIPNVPFCA